MRPEEYLRIILRRWWLVPLIAIVAALVAYVYTSAQPSVYSSSTVPLGHGGATRSVRTTSRPRTASRR